MLNRLLFARHLDTDESIQYVVHRHWLFGLKALFWPTVTFIGFWLLLYSIPDRHVFYGVAIAATATLIWWIRNFCDYFLDAWLVTTKGVIDLEWHGWFHRQASRVLYSDIHTVSYEVKGVLATLLGFGDVSIEKISTGSVIAMPSAKNPRRVESLILACLERYMHTKNLKDAKTVQTLLAEFVASSMQQKEPSKKHTPH